MAREIGAEQGIQAARRVPAQVRDLLRVTPVAVRAGRQVKAAVRVGKEGLAGIGAEEAAALLTFSRCLAACLPSR